MDQLALLHLGNDLSDLGRVVFFGVLIVGMVAAGVTGLCAAGFCIRMMLKEWKRL